jgi:hypothetical protein
VPRTQAEAMEEPAQADARFAEGAGMGSDAGALVAQGVTLMRVENESMLAVAIQRPRQLKKVLAMALEELKLVPEEAKRAYYSIPYKESQPDRSIKIVNVEGPSIKAAMALARLYGNCSVTARSLHEDAVGADLAGIFIDYETNFRVERPMRVTRVMKKRSGGTWTLNPQQWLAALQAAASKATRNAALNGLPAWLVASYMKTARAIAAGDPDAAADPKKVAGTLKAFARFNVTQAMLEKYVETPISEWMGDHLATLIGLGNAIADKQLTVEEAFELEQPQPESSTTPAGRPATATGGITPEAVAAGAVTEGGAPGTAPARTPAPREPGSDDGDEVEQAAALFTDAPKTEPDPAACTHPKVKRPVPRGKAHICPDCLSEVRE